jgi:SAM-dependent methyltransferase
MAKLDRRSKLLNGYNTRFYNRRIFVLARHLATSIPRPGRVLDIGCGDGHLALALMQLRPDLAVEGVDVVPRPKTMIPVTQYDGARLPHPDQSFDYVTIVDVLHHTTDPAAVLAEARRVAREGVVIKDHLREGFAARSVLVGMDWFGNLGDGVPMPYNFLSRAEWRQVFARVGLTPVRNTERLGLYLPPVSWICDRNLHFVALLEPARPV